MPELGETAILAPSAARTTNGASDAFAVPGDRQLGVLLDVTAVGGTGPSVTVSLEWSDDRTTWYPSDPADTMGAAITAVGRRVKEFDVKAPYVRAVWTVVGSVTFDLVAYVN